MLRSNAVTDLLILALILTQNQPPKQWDIWGMGTSLPLSLTLSPLGLILTHKSG